MTDYDIDIISEDEVKRLASFVGENSSAARALKDAKLVRANGKIPEFHWSRSTGDVYVTDIKKQASSLP